MLLKLFTNFSEERIMDLDELTEEISLLMKEFLLDVEEGNDPPLSLINELTFKLAVLDRERYLDDRG